MNYRLVSQPEGAYLECLPGDGHLASESHALDLIAACGEAGTNRLLLHAENLAPDFYDLKTRLAGDILLKFSNYRIKVAAVIAQALTAQGRFGEMVSETNRGSQFRVFDTRAEAQEWLLQN